MILRVPPRFRPAEIDRIDSRQFKMVINYASHMKRNISNGKGLLLAGPPGVGKTFALVALTKVYVDLFKRDYEFVTAPEFIENLPAVGPGVWDAYRGKFFSDTYTSVRWLVINDLGKEYRGGKLSEQVPYQFGRILRARCEKKLVTHISTNQSPDSLRDTYGDSLASLLNETMSMYAVDGPDRRKTL